jgi:hypothetical protein
MKHSYAFIALFLFPVFLLAQSPDGVEMKQLNVKRSYTINPKEFRNDFNLQVQSLEAPLPGGDLSKAKNAELKAYMNELYPRTNAVSAGRDGARTSDTLQVLNSFPATFWSNGTNLVGGTPNDNTLAISDGGNLLISWNSQLWGYDTEADTFLFRFPVKHPSFFQFLSQYNDTTYATPFPFDPKLMYDPTRDRFIMVFLVGGAPAPGTQGRDPETSNTIVCFSSSSDPKDLWYAYELDGNPLNYTTWTDYPQIAINENSFYLTLNQLYPDSGWVEGFAETVMWQMDLDAAFAGEDEVPTKFWTGFTHEGKNIRYLHPIKTGMGPQGDTMYMLANRPFTVTNDTFFLVRVTGTADDNTTDMDIKLVPSSLRYGHPPYAFQSGAAQRFWTNDARVLGGVRMGSEIQFTGNTIDTTTGKASIYHGFIDDAENPVITGRVIDNIDKELGFPNIAFIGAAQQDRETAIFCNHTAFNIGAGNSVIYVDNARNYSDVQTIKQSDTYVDMFGGGGDNLNERWGDYTGIQRKFNATSRVWVSGYWAFGGQRPGSWVAELASPKDGPVGVASPSEEQGLRMFPNPTMDLVQLDFELEQPATATVLVHDLQGREVAVLGKRNLDAGKNRMQFNAFYLEAGTYLVSIRSNGNVLWQEKLIKQ